ncbi:MAG: hypothetical protein ACK52C_04090 [Planctomycetia bacterium]|jgi:hypothetical protein
MFSPVSGLMAHSLIRRRPAGSPSTSTARAAGRWKFTKVPDLSAEMFGQINRASALPAYVSICRLIDQQGYRGTAPRRKGETAAQWRERSEAVRRAAREQGIILVGLHAIARDSGLDVSTIRRQVKRLHALGAIVLHHRGIVKVADRETGRITENRQGRTPAALVQLTVTPDQLRPANRAEAALRVAKCDPSEDVGGAECNPSGSANRVQYAPPSTDCAQTTQENPTPETGEEGRHPPAGAGGLPAAILGEGSVVTVDPSRPGIAIEEATRIPAGGTASRSAAPPSGPAPALRIVTPPDEPAPNVSPTPDRSTRSPDARLEAEVAAPPEPWPGPAGEALRRQWEAYARQRQADERENPPIDRRAARKARAEAGLIEAVAGLPAASVDACRRMGRQIEAEAARATPRPADPEAEALRILIERKRDAERQVRKQAAKAMKSTYRAAYALENT